MPITSKLHKNSHGEWKPCRATKRACRYDEHTTASKNPKETTQQIEGKIADILDKNSASVGIPEFDIDNPVPYYKPVKELAFGDRVWLDDFAVTVRETRSALDPGSGINLAIARGNYAFDSSKIREGIAIYGTDGAFAWFSKDASVRFLRTDEEVDYVRYERQGGY